MENLVPIGRFSKMTRLSVKALRHYDELGLLEPAVVDAASGYRYYRLSQANRAEAIRVLRSLDMPLDGIREALSAEDMEILEKVLERHRGRLEDELARHRRMLAFLQRLIERKEGVMPYEVQVKEVPDQRVVAVRKHTSLAVIGRDIGEGFGQIMAAMRGVPPSSAPFIVYHDVIDQETDGDIEICVPVEEPIEVGGDVRVVEVAGGTMATTVHRGPYDEIAPAYHTLSGWVQEHGHETTGAPREIYLTDPQETPAEDNLTEVQWPIR